MAKSKYFQDHGDHIRTLMEPEEFLIKHVQSIGSWTPVAAGKDVISKPKTDIIALQQEMSDLTFLGLIACTSRQNSFASAYPLAKGEVYEATITKVFEWKNKYEAYVWATIEDEFEFCFFATDYFCNKEKYQEGATLNLEVSALGVEVEPGHESFKLEGETAKKFREDMKKAHEIDDTFEIDESEDDEPLEMSCSELVAWFAASDECPDIHQFHSPIRSIKPLTACGRDFYCARIVISHDPDDIDIPFYFAKDLCQDIESKETIMGVLWLQAHVIDAFEPWEDNE